MMPVKSLARVTATPTSPESFQRQAYNKTHVRDPRSLETPSTPRPLQGSATCVTSSARHLLSGRSTHGGNVRGRGQTPRRWANRPAGGAQPMAGALQGLGGGAPERNGGVVGHWADQGRGPRGRRGRSGGGPSTQRGDGGGCGDGGSGGPGLGSRSGWRLLRALVPQRAAAPRQPCAAGGRARGALRTLRLHPGPLVRGLLLSGDQSMEVRGPQSGVVGPGEAAWPRGRPANSPGRPRPTEREALPPRPHGRKTPA